VQRKTKQSKREAFYTETAGKVNGCVNHGKASCDPDSLQQVNLHLT